jgi:WD40 repeat protein
LAFNPDGTELVTAGGYLRKPGRVRVWHVPTGDDLGNLLDPSVEVEGVAWRPGSDLVACACTDKGVQLYDRLKRRAAGNISHPSYARAVAFSRNGRYLASMCEKAVKVWDLQAGRQAWSVNVPGNSLVAWRIPVGIAFSPNGRTLAAPEGNNLVLLIDVAKGQPSGACSGHGGMVTGAAYSPDGKYLASGSFDKTVKIWDGTSGKLRGTLTGHTDWVFAVAFARDGKTLASAGREGTVILWDVTSRRKLIELSAHKSAVCVAFAPNGKTLASSGTDGQVKLWDVSRVVGH